ncbi:MAG: DUF5666 domain-containing protein [Caldilineaceae bacterium]
MSNLLTRQQKWPWQAIFCTLIVIAFSIVWTAQAAFASDDGFVGRVEKLPDEGLIGEWQVDGFVFVTSEATVLRQEKGEFAIGRCVEVEYVTVAAQTVATKIATKSNDDCDETDIPTTTGTPNPEETATATPTPSATHEDDDHGDDHGDDSNNTTKVLALIEELPTNGLRGVWTIGGVHYQVERGTHLRQKDGPFRVGACAELRYYAGTEPFAVAQLETQRMSKCHHGPGGTVPDPNTTPDPAATPDHDEDGSEVYGILDSFPAELIGEWIIAGTSYTATANTEFEQERGRFEVGNCVKAQLSTSAPSIIREVETTNRFRCGATDGDPSEPSGPSAHGEFYGVIQEFPANLMGEWHVGGITVVADEATEFQQHHGAFDNGVTVKVHFIVRDGTFYATEIETKFRNDEHGDDDDHNDIFEGAEGHAFGPIELLPDNLIGEWVVSGITYTVTSDTHFVRPHSDFALQVMVRVKYRTDADGKRIARQIKTTNEDNGASSEGHSTLFGFVDQMPASGFVGEWVIDGVTFQADATTKFKEAHGLLGLGAYVKMEYFVADGRKVLHEIESEVPPGAGDDTSIGEIEGIEDGSQPANNVRTAAATAVSATLWTIGGTQYVVTAATDLNDFQGALEVGQQAVVNSYMADDGSQVATQIRGVTLDEVIFLPSVNNR